MAKQSKPYGTWPSAITPAMTAAQSVRYGHAQADGPWVYWTESRPEEGGRGVVVRAKAGTPAADILAPPFSARSRVHEYGGAEFLVAADTLYFVNDSDQDIYALALDETGADAKPRRITRDKAMRFSDLAYDGARDRLLAVAERHSLTPGHHAPENLLAAVGLAGKARGEIATIASGRDFYAYPRLSADGKTLAWIAWDLPDMPWDQARLFVATLKADGTVSQPKVVAGGNNVAVFQPEWSPDGTLFFVADGDGWGMLHAREPDGTIHKVLSRRMDLSRPLWGLGARSYAIGPDGTILGAYLDKGETRLLALELSRTKGAIRARAREITTPFRAVGQIMVCGNGFAGIATRDTAAPAVVTLPLRGRPRILSEAGNLKLAPAAISKSAVHVFKSSAGARVYGLYYPPQSDKWRGPRGSKPPAIISVHGGPTGMANRGLALKVQFWTSRGFAVFDVDYSGSTGFGRAYRERLDGNWGICDVADAIAAAGFLADEGLADPDRIAISGGSAGGYTVLMALAGSDTFAAASCSYGVSDLALLLASTHKFESGYLHRLMGTTPKSWKKVFAERSPVQLADKIRRPAIFFQGLDDKIVPPDQSQSIVDTLKGNGVDVAYHTFAGEGHGFRRGDTIIAVLKSEQQFYRRVLRLGRK